MRIMIIGSRSIASKDNENYAVEAGLVRQFLRNELEKLPEDVPVTVLSGGAKGVDTIAEEFAKENRLDFILFKPYHLIDNKVEYMPRFFFSRNKQMVDNSDAVIAIWDGESNGAKHAIEYANKRRKPVTVVTKEELLK